MKPAWLEIAHQLGQILTDSAIKDKHGLTWRVPETPLASYNLYDGVTGIAMFLAALSRVTGEAKWGEVAQLAVQPMSYYFAKPISRERLAQRAYLGAGVGIGSWIYSLVRLGQWLDQPDLWVTARHAARMITPEKIAADTRYDVLMGSAGAMVGLLTLYEVTADESLLSLARACGTHLLAQRIMTESGYRAWPTFNGQVISGLAHGAAGIAYALTRLAEVDKAERWLEAIHEALAWERTTFAPEWGNWYAFGSNATAPIMKARWCHGAAGIGLARLGMLPGYNTLEMRQDIETALVTTATWPEPLDLVCCGNAGQMELFITASERLTDSAWWRVAEQRATDMLQRYQTQGYFELGSSSDIVDPTFFKGLAGIGYQYLRLAYPESLPSVLLWQ